MDALYDLIIQSLEKVWGTFVHNWPFLLASILIAVLLKLYLKPEKITAFLIRHQRAGVIGATAAAVSTPLCSCGTTAVILGMMASTLPWAPIVAFMVSSPLTSPQELVFSAGLFGWPFALAFFVSSILLGLLGGAAAGFAERRGWLANQSRFAYSRAASNPSSARPQQLATASSCCNPVPSRELIFLPPAQTRLIPANPDGQVFTLLAQPASACCFPQNVPNTKVAPVSNCDCEPAASKTGKLSFAFKPFLTETWSVSKKLLVMFAGFAFIGYFLNGLIPTEWVSKVFGSGTIYSVPLAAILGLPLYLNTEATLPLVRAMLDNGMSQGAAMAFLITGAGTSIGALGGALTIARWRIIAMIIGVLTVGAVLMGYFYNLMIGFGWV